MLTLSKRVLLFTFTNILVLTSVSVILWATGLGRALQGQGIHYEVLLVICTVWGVGGSFISLALSKVMAKWMMGVQIIDPGTADPDEQHLYQMLVRLSRAANIPVPEFGTYDSPEVNAFATGPSKNNSLVAVSTGLLYEMEEEEIEGVIAHELAHIANGDMVTMTLIQGIVNAFAMFLARMVAYVIIQATSRDDSGGGFMGAMAYYIVVSILQGFFLVLGSIVVNTFSRWREYRADAGGAKLAGREKMIAALVALKEMEYPDDVEGMHPAYKTMQISSQGSLMELFATHPPLDERIKALEEMKI